MRKQKGILLLTICIAALVSSVVVYAAPRGSAGWNVYNSSKTVYANVGASYVSDSFAKKGVVSCSARVLGEDKDKIIQSNAAKIVVVGEDGEMYYEEYFYNGKEASKTFKVPKAENSHVTVQITIDDRSGTRNINLD